MPIKHWTSNGELWDFTGEVPPQIGFDTLLQTLAREKRFANEAPWTVLQHSMAVGLAAKFLYPGNIPLIQYAFAHDFQEAVVRDVPTPIKTATKGAFHKVEQEIQTAMFRSLNIPSISAGDYEAVHQIDKIMCYAEIAVFFNHQFALDFEKEEDIDPYVLVHATHALLQVHSQPLTDTESGRGLNPWIVDTFKRTLGVVE